MILFPFGLGAHPRSRGEHKSSRKENQNVPGSSPLARGTRELRGSSWLPGGLIPARAGNTMTVSSGAACRRAHPRSRGEHRWLHSFERRHGGSSPLARGTLFVSSINQEFQGLIPARAGNTCIVHDSGVVERAHPRSRGEHDGAGHFGFLRLGSSPLPRGTRCFLSGGVVSDGLIPARAGNTSTSHQARVVLGAHPRSRGEHMTRCAAY